MENFCNYNDANAFMLECAKIASLGDHSKMIETAQKLESPLEVVMLGALTAVQPYVKCLDANVKELLAAMEQYKAISYELRAAVPIGTYRADFIMTVKMDAPIEAALLPAPVIIECDGYNYHDKTREQARYDRQRDRHMQRQGFVVARFTGDEILEQPFECAFEVMDLVLRSFGRVNRDLGPEGGWPVFGRGNPGRYLAAMTVEQFYTSEVMEVISNGQ
jgi:very-short-patch-repair endonuclease